MIKVIPENKNLAEEKKHITEVNESDSASKIAGNIRSDLNSLTSMIRKLESEVARLRKV